MLLYEGYNMNSENEKNKVNQPNCDVVSNNIKNKHAKTQYKVSDAEDREVLDLYSQISNQDVKQCFIDLLRDLKE